ncbi:unnamed protein product [Darwinula stevensoni]|uniref:Fibronectin type-III domain-containing protein n=1 Tax=Darwinula stevensoni TaxID=69355 RepID=A0A7R9AAA4_9CRUS|nr:unnamed protein product [Darwinula stevensoni]CAG0898253.1 unnamed protein product [Darwinula stevensoni]
MIRIREACFIGCLRQFIAALHVSFPSFHPSPIRSHPSKEGMQCWAIALIIPGFFTVVEANARNRRSWGVGELAWMQPEGGILGKVGQYIFESGEDIKLFCTLTEAGLSEGLFTSDLRFETPSNDVVKPNFWLNDKTVSLLIANATTGDSGRYECGNVSNDENVALFDTVTLEIGYPRLKSWRCWSMQLELLHCNWSRTDNLFETKYTFYIQTDGTKMTECRQEDPAQEECEARKGQTPPYRPGETEMNIKVKARNVLGNRTFTYPFDHYRNIKIEALENVAVKTVDAETLNVTWDLPAGLHRFNVPVLHNIQLVPQQSAEELNSSNVNYTIPGASNRKSWNYTFTDQTPNTMYDVTIKAIVADAEFPDLWSNNSTASSKTLPKAPDRSPEMPLGSFHVDRIDDGFRNIYLYWIPLKDWEHYSDNFSYLVEGREIQTNEVVQPNMVKYASAVFGNLSTESAYNFSIVSSNEMGKSPLLSIIEVYEETNRIPCPTIHRDSPTNDGRYLLEWKASEERKIENFTVFWCRSPTPWPVCDTGIDWEVVSKDKTTFEWKSVEPLKFAVSANGESGHSGLCWERAKVERELGYVPASILTITVLIMVALFASAALCGKRLWKQFRKIGDVDIILPQDFLDITQKEPGEPPNQGIPYKSDRGNHGINEYTPGSPTIKTSSPVQEYEEMRWLSERPKYWNVHEGQLCPATSQGRCLYVSIDHEDEEESADGECDEDSRNLDDDFEKYLVDYEKLMKPLGIVKTVTEKEMLNPGYVKASVLSAQDEKNNCFILNKGLGMIPPETNQEHDEESLQISRIFEGEASPARTQKSKNRLENATDESNKSGSEHQLCAALQVVKQMHEEDEETAKPILPASSRINSLSDLGREGSSICLRQPQRRWGTESNIMADNEKDVVQSLIWSSKPGSVSDIPSTYHKAGIQEKEYTPGSPTTKTSCPSQEYKEMRWLSGNPEYWVACEGHLCPIPCQGRNRYLSIDLDKAATEKEKLSPGYVNASVLSAQDEKTNRLSLNIGLGKIPQETNQEHD